MDYRKARQTLLWNRRVSVYSILVLFLPIISSFILTEDYKIDKRNILNQWFVKLGWFWTNIFLLPLMFYSINIEDKESVSRAIFRIISSTLIWYSSVNLFQFLDVSTGFDISGHTFLLIFSNLIIASELKLLDVQNKLESIKSTDNELSNKRKANERIETESTVSKIKIILRLLTLIWDFMLLQTTLYYHTILQKVIAALWAIGSWYLLHLLFYQKPHLELESRGRGARKNEHIS